MSAEQKLISMQIVLLLSPGDVPHPDGLVGAAGGDQPRVPLLLPCDGDTRDIPGVT